MSHRIRFYPVGNGDTSQILLENGKRILFDYRHQKQGEHDDCPVIDLEKALREELRKDNRDYFDVVAFTHGDNDHIQNSTEFFELLHADKYQGPDRIKIRELWVPAAMILETGNRDEQSNEFIIWRQEARHRLKKGQGIQVFSKPEKLKDWLNDQGLTLDSRRHLITDAGQLAKGFSLTNDEVEFFCHSPFVKHVDHDDVLRNEATLIFQVRFEVRGTRTNYFAVGDTTYDVLEDIVRTTNWHGNGERLDWDLFNIPHHCSYRALGPDKGEKETAPTDLVKEFLLHGQNGSYEVSSSNPIDESEDAHEQAQPPHIQAKKTYEKHLHEVQGRGFLVTMEEPSRLNPRLLEFEISNLGLRWAKVAASASAGIASSKIPRAGKAWKI